MTAWKGFPTLAVISAVVVAFLTFIVATLQPVQDLVVTSDQLTIISLADDILKDPHFSVYLWNYSHAPYFFPDLAATIVLKTLIRGDAEMAAAMLVLQSAFIAGAGVWMSARFAGSASGRANAVGLYGAAMVLAFTGLSRGWSIHAVMWPFISYSHAGALDCTLVGFVALTRRVYAEPRRGIVTAVATAVTILAYCSDKVAIVLFLPPAFLYLAALSRRDGFARLATFAAIQAVALSATFAVDRLLYLQPLEGVTVAAMPEHLASISRFFATQPPSLRIAAALTAAVAALILVRSSLDLVGRRTDAPRAGSDLPFLLSCSMLLDALLCIWQWTSDDPVVGRFAVMIEFAGPVLLVHGLRVAWPPAGRSAVAGPAALSGAVLLSLLTWGGVRDPFGMVHVQRQRGAELLGCVARNGLHAGYAAYWHARQLSSSTDWKVQLDQFMPNQPVPFFWGSDLIWFFDRLRGGAPARHDFVLLDDLPPDEVEAEYGRPDSVESCGAHRLAVYRDSRKLEDAVASRLGSVLAVDGVRTHLPRRVLAAIADRQIAFGVGDLNSLVGERVDGAVRLSPGDGPGFGLFGPYVTLVEGSYTVDIAFACSGRPDGSYLDVSAGGGQDEVAAWPLGDHLGECDGGTRHARLAFTLRQPVSSVEVRAYYGGEGELSVTGVEVKRSPET